MMAITNFSSDRDHTGSVRTTIRMVTDQQDMQLGQVIYAPDGHRIGCVTTVHIPMTDWSLGSNRRPQPRKEWEIDVDIDPEYASMDSIRFQEMMEGPMAQRKPEKPLTPEMNRAAIRKIQKVLDEGDPFE